MRDSSETSPAFLFQIPSQKQQSYTLFSKIAKGKFRVASPLAQ